MTTRQQIIESARSCLKTPHAHLGRQKGLALDCIGLLVIVARENNLTYHDQVDYSRTPTGQSLVEGLVRAGAIEIGLIDVLDGDILVFWIDRSRQPCHCGIKTPIGMIHCYATSQNGVVEHRIDEFWSKRLVRAFRFPGIE